MTVPTFLRVHASLQGVGSKPSYIKYLSNSNCKRFPSLDVLRGGVSSFYNKRPGKHFLWVIPSISWCPLLLYVDIRALTVKVKHHFSFVSDPRVLSLALSTSCRSSSPGYSHIKFHYSISCDAILCLIHVQLKYLGYITLGK